MINREYLNNLNEAQKEAVMHLDGPLLIVAGAGSGKTKVLTSRIANIIKEKKAFPNQILAVTFTNKAAKEMQNRVSKILGSAAIGLSWLGTFHSICAKLLRKHAPAVNLNSNFTIVDTDDQIRLIKNICKAENIDIKQLAPRYIIAIIDKWKNKGLYPKDVILKKKETLEKNFLNIYKIYQQKLIDLNCADFSDLILHTVKIFKNYKDISELYSKKFKYILVDEYQDTNVAQYLWLRLLAQKHKNICCVGDDDQSIYGWRGAEVGNILKFEKDFFDSIACISVISLLQSKKNVQILINEFYRILKPGGKLLIDMNGPKGDFKKGGKFINEDEYEYNLQNKRKIKIYAPKNIQSFKKIFEKFKIIELGEVYFKYFEFRNHEFIACLEKPLGEKPSKIFK